MRLANPFSQVPFHPLLESLLPDFVLAFAFFTALTYAVLGKRFDHQRPAVVMSGALGLALATGLVWWEHGHGWSIRNLGPVAIGVAVILLGMILFQAIRQTGGSWSGAGIALGASILVASLLGLEWPGASGMLPAAAVLALIIGVVVFLTRAHGGGPRAAIAPGSAGAEYSGVRHDMSNLYEDGRVGDRLKRRFGELRQAAESLPGHADRAGDVMAQLHRMLPAEGWLTGRLARLRAKAHLVRKGHVARIEELREVMKTLAPNAKKQASQELAARFKELRLDRRLERLDRAVAENERRVRELTREAEQALARYDYRKLTGLLEAAEKLQGHNSKLLQAVERTEAKLAKVARNVAKPAPQGEAK